MSELFEQLAEIEHCRWSGWMIHLFGKGKFNDDGSFTIDAESVRRWDRQMKTNYSALSETEKESDRVEVRKYMPFIREKLRVVTDERDRLKIERDELEWELAALEIVHEEALKLLRDLEWSSFNKPIGQKFCKFCGHSQRDGHSESCEFWKFISRFPEKKERNSEEKHLTTIYFNALQVLREFEEAGMDCALQICAVERILDDEKKEGRG